MAPMLANFYFLEKDFAGLCERIEATEKELKKIGLELGESCKQSSETWHDNFPFEEGKKQQYMQLERLCGLIKIKNGATIIRPKQTTDTAEIGSLVTIEDKETQQKVSYKIGSYMVFDSGENEISYESPIGKMLLGAKIGETKSAIIGGRQKNFRIIGIK